MNIVRTALLALALCSGAANAAGPAADPVSTDSAKAQYEQERANCMSGTTGQDKDACLRSASAAYALVKEHRLRDPNVAYRDNALARCAVLPDADRADCISRVDGGGERSGSVKGGGVITETVTTTVSPK